MIEVLKDQHRGRWNPQAHSLEFLLKKFLEVIQKVPGVAAPVRLLATSKARTLYAYLFEKIGKVETPLRMTGESRATPFARLELAVTAMETPAVRSIRGW